jgi:hypothetical protein
LMLCLLASLKPRVSSAIRTLCMFCGPSPVRKRFAQERYLETGYSSSRATARPP